MSVMAKGDASPARIAILGAESTGKSTLAETLARRHGTLWVPEYLREFVDTMGRGKVACKLPASAGEAWIESDGAAIRCFRTAPVPVVVEPQVC